MKSMLTKVLKNIFKEAKTVLFLGGVQYFLFLFFVIKMTSYKLTFAL